jgi:Flp pilus assembly protein TadD
MPIEAEYARGLQLYGSGNYLEAEKCFRICLEYCPDNPDMLNALGSALDAGGSPAEAVPFLERACRLRQESAPFHHNLANILRRIDCREKAEREYLEALKYDPELPEALYGLGSIYLEEGRLEPADACLLRTISFAPGFSAAIHDLGQIRQRQGKLDEAEQYYRRSVEADNTFVPAINSLGMLLLRRNRVEEARRFFEQALAINPHYLQARCNLAVLATWCGDFDFAISELKAAVLVAPHDGDIHFNLSLALLAAGDIAEGLTEHEWRFQKANPVPIRYGEIPRWRGESLVGKRLLIHAEQGYGDSLQFIRYAPLLAAQGCTVYVEGQDSCITPLLATVPGVAGAFPRGTISPDVDVQIPMMSLPFALGKSAWPPPQEAYLFPSPDKIRFWRDRLSSLPGIKVGLAWAGRSEHENDLNRSLSTAFLVPFGDVRGVSFVSLQFGPDKPGKLSFWVADYSSEIVDFCDSGALTSNLDLIITVDSAIAHLAGGLGVPAFLLLPWNPDWRWFRDRSDSPWYPRMKLYRQESCGVWSQVIEDVIESLMMLLEKSNMSRRSIDSGTV